MTRYMIYGIVTVLFLGWLVASLVPSQINAVRRFVGLDLLYESEAPAMSGDVGGVVDEVAAEPVPGVLDDPPALGAVATAVAECVPTELPPSEPVLAGLRRYVLAVAAIGLAREHPLSDPRYRDLYPLLGKGPLAALADARTNRLGSAERSTFAELHAAFRDPDHPLYKGLNLHSGTMHGLNFEKAADALATQWQQVAACAEERAALSFVQWEPLTPE